ncbi:hypothetical protein FM755_04740 [Francisella tularensis]|uniref:Pathogenicity deteminant protein pdpB n=9 Tax=Francisella tularensis TaxID=263 RepID=A0AAI8FUH4_FRATH|nr:hypothetical protein [Francisella tularensis]AFX69837.1 pathogenicity deteminant protein PdpB [Francisella tularensis subsp. holarctica F92]ABU60611.1 pathogenicity deteminant protein pdpB [Francisella tularensis subsp. holarctica FTNF002-00]ABU61710.1 pathogenicity deteminant protein pdpB [Francisella tularensis subsp. holarctica FTNF002-00]AFT92134.1 PdpB protein [Francisella tularensis subsp. holarctica FSC200]AFT92922.1 PdpB protein [Francisella tularensis subsp. holarctica FSC200]
MNFIKNHQILIISLTIAIIVLSVLGIFMIKKWLKTSRNPNKKSASKTIKNAKSLIKKNKVKNNLSELYIFYGDYLAAKDYITKIKPQAQIIDNNELPLIAIDKNNTSLVFANNEFSYLYKLKKKLNLQFYKLNFCFDISDDYYHENIKISEIYKELLKLRLKNFIISFYTLSEHTRSYNNAIDKKSIFKLTSDADTNHKAEEEILSKILSSKDDVNNKYNNVKILNQIRKLLKNIHPQLKSINKETFFNFGLNTPDNIIAKKDTIFFSSFPKSIIINLISLLFSFIFIVNIFQEINIKKKFSIQELNQLHESDSNKIIEETRKKIDEAILLDILYPKSIKYHFIYKQYADTLLKNVILPKYNDTYDLSMITSFLIFFEYLDNKIINQHTNRILKIISSITNLSEKQLDIVVKYTTPSIRTEMIKSAINRANKLYTNRLIVVGKDSKSYLSTKGFNAEYLGISNTKRAKVINNIYIQYLYKCATDNAILDLNDNYIIPIEVNNIFKMYQEQFDTSSKKLCNSSYINSITKSVSLILNQEENKRKFESFSDMLDHIYYLVKSLEKNAKDVADDGKKQTSSITVSLINYVINSVVNPTYNKNELPLISPVSKNLYMEFAPNFYSKRILISPIYSKEYIKDNIDPTNKKFNRLVNNLKNNFNIEPDFMIAIYKSSINNYIEKYIGSYNKMIDSLNNDSEFNKNISNKGALKLYLLAMSSKDSSFNSLIEFYSTNTDLITNESETNSSKKINKLQHFYGEITKLNKQNNTNDQNDKSLWAPIDNYFKENDKYLESKSYADYKNIFKQLNNLIIEQGYSSTYKNIKQGYEPLQKVYSELSKINNHQGNNNLYKLLKKHLDIAINTIKTIAIQDAITKLDNTVNIEYEYINNQFPFNKDSNSAATNEAITKDFDNNGYIYSGFIEQLSPLLFYNKTDDRWESKDFSKPEEIDYLNKFNKVYLLNKLLWDDKINPKAIKFDITPIPNKDNDYTFFSIILDKQNYVNSLNIKYSDSIEVLYNWNSLESTTITIKFEDGSNEQISYQGKWSILKAIKDANCDQNNICTWIIKHKGKKYPLSFKIESKFLQVLGWQKQGEVNVQ